jgi:hypothetical protein
LPANQRVTNEQIVEAYRAHGSVWKAAKVLGVVGQSVWERLKALGYPMPNRRWSAEELAELRALVDHCTLSDIAARLARPYYGVAMMVSRLGIAVRAGNKVKRKVPRGAGLTKDRTRVLTRELDAFSGSLRQFCRMHGLTVDALAAAVQQYQPGWWAERSQSRGFAPKACRYCGGEFFPMNEKQETCSRRCQSFRRADRDYFGGRRRDAIGMLEGVCQLCFRQTEKGLSAHHMIGKEHDPDNELLVALCPGCHRIVEALATRKFCDAANGWERLIELVMARRLPKQMPRADGSKLAATYTCVEIEYLTEDEWRDLVSEEEPQLAPTA